MANDDTFRERVFVPKETVRENIQLNHRAEILELPGFGDPMTEWSDRMASVGQQIVPKTVYLVQLYEQHEHRVAWVYHSWRRPDSIEECHHIACDCVANMDEPDEQMEEVLDCPAVLSALEHRAQRVSEVLRTGEILQLFGKKDGDPILKPHAKITAKGIINFIMNYDKEHPEGWAANVVSGEHQIPLLAATMQVLPFKDPMHPDRLTIEDVVTEMDRDGSLELHEDGLTVSLPIAA